ncbi:hypothetical protein FB567DRAFT_627335 [Paraphoma chrysanthemicola]|uniref:Uncharacterized protein n=1 Tax=Paraphoma chrysanthemicola TaxID=798071 RepID=A0A8K0VZG7_9PLEO|nr:hypothetical protein FB567DRAFT_627335 [Paraphoma chrysanthemicola]
MSDIEQKIRDATLDDDVSMAELWQRYNFFINDAEAPARIRAQGLAIFRAVLFTEPQPASQVSERAVVLLRRTLEAIGGLYLAEERCKASILAVDQAGSAIDPVQLQTRLRSPSPAAELLPSTDIIDLTDDNDMQLDEGFERRERRRTRDRARRGSDKSARDSVLHELYSNAAPSTISTEVAQSMEPTSSSPSSTMLPNKSSKYAARPPISQPNSLIVKLNVPSLNNVIKQSDKAVKMGASRTKAAASATKPRLKRKYQRRFAPKSEEFVTSDLDDDDRSEDGNLEIEMEDASPAQDEHSRRQKMLGKAKKLLGSKKREGAHRNLGDLRENAA